MRWVLNNLLSSSITLMYFSFQKKTAWPTETEGMHYLSKCGCLVAVNNEISRNLSLRPLLPKLLAKEE